MYVKVVICVKKEHEDKWKHDSTAIYEANKIRVQEMKDGSRELNISCIHDKEPRTVILSDKTRNVERVDVFVENEKGDTIGRY